MGNQANWRELGLAEGVVENSKSSDVRARRQSSDRLKQQLDGHNSRGGLVKKEKKTNSERERKRGNGNKCVR